MKFLSHILKHKKKYAALIIILLIATYFLWPKPPKPLETQIVKKMDLIQSLSETGTIDSTTTVNLSFLASSQLTYIGAKKGDFVKKGQIIAAVDQRTIERNLQTAFRNYSEQRNTFDQTIDNNQGRTVQSALSDAMKRILQNNQFDLEKAVLSVELQDLAKQQSILTSPIDGIVTKEDITTPGVTILATNTFSIADANHLVFKIDVDEADIGKVKMGDKVTISLDSYPNQTQYLHVDRIDFTTHTTSTGGNAYTVESDFPLNNNVTYRIGMNGSADIILAEKKKVLTVPVSSIANNFVYVKTPQGFEKRKVAIGLMNDINAEILTGLSAGENVALDPTQAQQQSQKKGFF